MESKLKYFRGARSALLLYLLTTCSRLQFAWMSLKGDDSAMTSRTKGSACLLFVNRTALFKSCLCAFADHAHSDTFENHNPGQ
jgi:hypothetical protein